MDYIASITDYTGGFLGIEFEDGQARIDDQAATETGRTLPQLLLALKDLGVHVEQCVYPCSKCDRVFESEHGLKVHMAVHGKKERR